MQPAGSGGGARGNGELCLDAELNPLVKEQSWPYVASVVVVILCMVADLFLPQGATPAIGYVVVPLLAVRTHRRGFLLWITSVCTALTWGAYLLEPPGEALWFSIFERAMVTWVIWLTLFLVWRREVVMSAMTHQALEMDKLSRELARSNQDLESFASVAAHDLRGPLNAALMTVELLANPAPEDTDAERSRWLGFIRSELMRMADLIQSLLTYGRASSGPVEKADCACDELLSTVLESLRADLQKNNAQVTHDPLPTVMAHPSLLSELLQNLIENAVKYHGQAPPRVHVSAARDENGWVFSVRDNGIGLHPRDSEKIFKPFQRAQTDGIKRPGSGIGLATCKRIVERHGGRIWVESSPGQGATFHFTLPEAPCAEALGPIAGS